MPEDLVEFGSPTVATKPKPRVERTHRRFTRPPWLADPMLPTAAVGAALAAASLFGPWQKVLPSQEQIRQQPEAQEMSLTTMLATMGTIGAGYLVAMVATVVVTALYFYGHPGVRATARVIGIALSGVNAVVLAAAANALSKGYGFDNFFIVISPQRDDLTMSLEWGIYAAFAGVIAIGAALIWARSGRPAADHDDETVDGQGEGDRHPEMTDDGVIDLSVSVHPAGKQVAAD